jgi:low temperature requirement protein LtrA
VAPEPIERGVSNLELFFDLVFVFTLTQLTSLLEHGISVEAAFRTALILTVLFWMYGGFVWLTNQVPPDNTPRRLLLLVGMGALLICAMAIPRAFDDRGVAFGIGYLLVVIVHGAMYVEAYGTAALRFVPANIVGALCVTAAGFLGGIAAYALWVVAIVFQFGAQLLLRFLERNRPAGFDLRPAHFVERHDLLLLIAFGESVVATGIGASGLVFDAGVAGAALLGLALTAALWWTHFGDDDDRAEHTLRSASVAQRAQMAINAYFYAYIVMLFGVIAIAAGVRLSLEHVTDALALGPALLLGGGVALYLAGDSVFRRVMRLGRATYRAVAAVLSLGVVALAVAVSAAAALAILVAIVVATLVIEGAQAKDARLEVHA